MEFSGGPVVRTWHFHCKRHCLTPGQGTKISCAAWRSQNKKKGRNKINTLFIYLLLSHHGSPLVDKGCSIVTGISIIKYLHILYTHTHIYIKNKILRHKLNQRWKIFTLITTKHDSKKLKMTQTNVPTTHVHGFEDLMLLIYSILPKVIYRFNAILSKIPIITFGETEKFILKVKRDLNGLRIAKIIFSKNKVWRSDTSWYENLIKSYSNQTTWQRHKAKTLMDYNSRKPRNKPSHMWSNNFWQGCRDSQWGRHSLFNKW